MAHNHFNIIIIILIIIYDYTQGCVRHFQALRKVLALLQEIHYFRTDRHAWSRGRTADPTAPALHKHLPCGDLGKLTFLLPTLCPSHLLGLKDVQLWLCSCFCLRISFCAKSKCVLERMLFSFGKKRKWRILFAIAFCQMLALEKYRKKPRKCRFGVFCKSCQSLEFSGESTVEISETSYFFVPENKFEPKNQVALWVRNRWNPFFLWFVLQLLFISSCLVLPAYWNILRALDALQTFPAKSLAVPAAFALQGRGSKGRGWTDWPLLSKCQLVTGLLHPKIGREQEV